MSVTELEDRDIVCFTNSRVRVPAALQILTDKEHPPTTNSTRVWRFLSIKNGDKRVVWDSMSIAQISEAEKMFNKLKKEGMDAFRVGVDGKMSSDKMEEFDPFAEEVIFVPMRHVVGG